MEQAGGSDTLVGRVIAQRWRLVKLLGQGAMGAVFLAEGLGGEGQRAVKILHVEFVKEEQVVSRFYAEAEASKRLVHPNIARIYESGTTPWGAPFLLMELLTGKSLGDAVPPGARMPVPEAAWVMQSVLQALRLAHEQDIVHRDLKPDNIFLCDNPDRTRTVKLLDFGIARVIEQATGGKARKTATGMVLGTPGYMSPEQLKSSKSVDPRSDLWSLGAVFFEIITGYDPFGVTNDMQRMFAILTQDAPPVDAKDPSLAPWRPFFERALRREPGERFQSAMEMHDAITAIMAGRPMPAGSPTPKSAEPAAPAAQIPAPPPAQTAPGAPEPAKAEAAQAAAPRPAGGSNGLVLGLGIAAVLVLVAITAVVVRGGAGLYGAKGVASAAPSASARATTSAGTTSGKPQPQPQPSKKR